MHNMSRASHNKNERYLPQDCKGVGQALLCCFLWLINWIPIPFQVCFHIVRIHKWNCVVFFYLCPHKDTNIFLFVVYYSKIIYPVTCLHQHLWAIVVSIHVVWCLFNTLLFIRHTDKNHMHSMDYLHAVQLCVYLQNNVIF